MKDMGSPVTFTAGDGVIYNENFVDFRPKKVEEGDDPKDELSVAESAKESPHEETPSLPTLQMGLESTTDSTIPAVPQSPPQSSL